MKIVIAAIVMLAAIIAMDAANAQELADKEGALQRIEARRDAFLSNIEQVDAEAQKVADQIDALRKRLQELAALRERLVGAAAASTEYKAAIEDKPTSISEPIKLDEPIIKDPVDPIGDVKG